MQHNCSEVAQLKQQIELEWEAGKRALHGFAEVGRHEQINGSMGRMWDRIERLEVIAGKEECKAFLLRL